VTDPRPQDELRASDADRDWVVERLRQAHGEGRLDLAEFDERTARAYAARTYGELAAVTADLPAVDLLAAPRPAAAESAPSEAVPAVRSGAERTLWAATGAWLTVSLINLVIWGSSASRVRNGSTLGGSGWPDRGAR
jgi:hypothetical protein